MREYKLGAAAIIRDEAGSVLLVKHNYGRLNWELPGGGTEAYESVLDTVRREVREETGLEVEVERLSGVYYEPDIDFHHFVFACSSKGRQAVPDHVEITECRYWPTDELPRPISDFTVRRIMDGLSSEANPLPITIGPRLWLEGEGD